MRTRGSEAPTVIEKASPLLADERFQLARHVEHERAQHDRLGVHLQSARGDLGDIEHLIDEMAQMRRRRGDTIHGWYLARCEVAVKTVAQQFDETDDGVERRAQLVRDVREEFALRLVGALHVAVESLEFNRTSSDMECALLFSQEPKCEEEHAGDTERPHVSKRSDRVVNACVASTVQVPPLGNRTSDRLDVPDSERSLGQALRDVRVSAPASTTSAALLSDDVRLAAHEASPYRPDTPTRPSATGSAESRRATRPFAGQAVLTTDDRDHPSGVGRPRTGCS